MKNHHLPPCSTFGHRHQHLPIRRVACLKLLPSLQARWHAHLKRLGWRLRRLRSLPTLWQAGNPFCRQGEGLRVGVPPSQAHGHAEGAEGGIKKQSSSSLILVAQRLDDQCESRRLTLWRIFQKPPILSAACGGEQTRTDVLTLSARTHVLTSSNVVDSSFLQRLLFPNAVLVLLYQSRNARQVSKILQTGETRETVTRVSKEPRC